MAFLEVSAPPLLRTSPIYHLRSSGNGSSGSSSGSRRCSGSRSCSASGSGTSWGGCGRVLPRISVVVVEGRRRRSSSGRSSL